MRRFAPRVAIVPAVAALAGAAPATGPMRPIEIARITSAIDESEIVGLKRAGILCLPQGSIRWGDVGGGSSLDQRGVVEDAFEDADVPVTPLGIAPERNARLRATVRTAVFALCARNWLGDAKTRLSGDAMVRIEWRLETPDGAPPRSHVSEITRSFDARHAAPLGSLYRLMLTDAAVDAAAWLKAGRDGTVPHD